MAKVSHSGVKTKRFGFQGIFERPDGRIINIDGEISAKNEKDAELRLRQKSIETIEISCVP